MSVLVKGMEMPKACWECPLKVHLFQQLWCTPSNKVINRNDNTKREPDCPLVEVPNWSDKWQVYTEDEEGNPLSWFCPNCEEVVETKWKFCPECGIRKENGSG